jgi:hypothetical protein
LDQQTRRRWNVWVQNLAEILHDNQLPTDTTKLAPLVHRLQQQMPPQKRLHQNDKAKLARAIAQALRGDSVGDNGDCTTISFRDEDKA